MIRKRSFCTRTPMSRYRKKFESDLANVSLSDDLVYEVAERAFVHIFGSTIVDLDVQVEDFDFQILFTYKPEDGEGLPFLFTFKLFDNSYSMELYQTSAFKHPGDSRKPNLIRTASKKVGDIRSSSGYTLAWSLNSAIEWSIDKFVNPIVDEYRYFAGYIK